ncbi:M20/M25/M40 family metallo-hydrolase [Candidatus Woesearchaeota archaeon]|nr:M20/M25/M40 family metallo-hydrolase [Candidatus Woesearchaeota archaeon]
MDKTPVEECVALTKKLMHYQTTEEQHDEFTHCITFLKQYFAATPLVVKEFHSNKKPSLFISFDGKKHQKLLLNGHLDVVAGDDTQFLPTVSNGKLWGRGSSDMKAALAIMVVLLKTMAQQQKHPKVGLMIVSDEEIGGHHGTEYLLNKGYAGDFVITGEPTSLGIETRHKGILQVKVTACGRSCHACRPWLGENAIEKLFFQYSTFCKRVGTTAHQANEWLPSVNVTNIFAQGPVNVTPEKAEMILDIRTTENVTNKQMMQLMKEIGFTVAVLQDSSLMINDEHDHHITSLQKIATKILGTKVSLIRSSGGSDTRYFTTQGIAGVNFGPVGKNHHQSNEYLEIKSIAPYYHILEQYIHKHCFS